MGTSINTNLTALGVQRYLNGSQNAVTNAMTRLSTGMRINSAKDDAAGLIIGERMSAQIRGMNVASRNANDAISLVQTAESSLASVTSALQRIRELTVQAANASNTDGDRATLNKEAQELIAEVDRISRDTSFNGVKLLNGDFKSQNFQVGANGGQTVEISKIVDARSTALGSSGLKLTGSAMGVAGAASATAGANGVTAEGNAIISTSAGSSPFISWSAGSSAKDIAEAINNKAGSVGVQATASTSATLSALSATGTVNLTINGTTVSANITNTADLTALADAINGSVSGVTATFANPPAKSELKLTAADGSDIKLQDFTNGTATLKVAGSAGTDVTLTSGGTEDSTTVAGSVALSSSKGAVTLTGLNSTAMDGAGSGGVSNGSKMGTAKAAMTDLTAAGNTNNGVSGHTLTLSSAQGDASVTVAANASAKAIAAAINTAGASKGISATASTKATLGSFAFSTGTPTGDLKAELKLNGATITGAPTGLTNIPAVQADLVSKINLQTGTTGVTATLSGTDIVLTADGRDISIENFKLNDSTGTPLNGTATVKGANDTGAGQTLTTAVDDSTVIAGTFELVGNVSWSGADATVFSPSTGSNSTTTAALNTLNSLDISSTGGAVAALKVIDTALDQVSSARGELGAKQNRLEALVSNVDVVSENLTAARSRLMDADFAKETAALSRAQILQQAGTAMLAQANALPQQVLQLLKG
jgi:flagellin